MISRVLVYYASRSAQESDL